MKIVIILLSLTLLAVLDQWLSSPACAECNKRPDDAHIGLDERFQDGWVRGMDYESSRIIEMLSYFTDEEKKELQSKWEERNGNTYVILTDAEKANLARWKEHRNELSAGNLSKRDYEEMLKWIETNPSNRTPVQKP